MPELPEVETIAAELRPVLVGQRFAAVHVPWPKTIATPSPAELAARLPGQEVIDVGRRGKYLLAPLASGAALIVHLRMTGRLTIETPDSPLISDVHVRTWFELASGACLVFHDERRFGRIWLVNDIVEVVGALGPEPLDPFFTAERFAQILAPRRTAIKALLLDQTALAGVGNIYADESLFAAGIHPLRPATSLRTDEIGRLHAAIRRVLSAAIDQRGTLLRDYAPPFGASGNYQRSLRVYRHDGDPCPTCGTTLERITITQRGTHFCPRCQPAV